MFEQADLKGWKCLILRRQKYFYRASPLAGASTDRQLPGSGLTKTDRDGPFAPVSDNPSSSKPNAVLVRDGIEEKARPMMKEYEVKEVLGGIPTVVGEWPTSVFWRPFRLSLFACWRRVALPEKCPPGPSLGAILIFPVPP